MMYFTTKMKLLVLTIFVYIHLVQCTDSCDSCECNSQIWEVPNILEVEYQNNSFVLMAQLNDTSQKPIYSFTLTKALKNESAVEDKIKVNAICCNGSHIDWIFNNSIGHQFILFASLVNNVYQINTCGHSGDFERCKWFNKCSKKIGLKPTHGKAAIARRTILMEQWKILSHKHQR